MVTGPSAVALLAALALPAGAGQTHVFDFRPRPGAGSDPRFVGWHDGACGPVAAARVRSIPGSGDRSFASDPVLELSSTSRILRRWQVPVNTVPVAVDGAVLLFRDGPTLYRTTTTGEVSTVDPVPPMAGGREAPCTMPTLLRGSAYARCWTVPRPGRPTRALLALQGPCT